MKVLGEGLIGQKAFAAEIGVTYKRVRGMVARGELPLDKEGHIKHAEALEAYARMQESKAPKGIPQTPDNYESALNSTASSNVKSAQIFKQAQAQAMAYKARKLKLEYEQMVGETIRKQEVVDAFAAVFADMSKTIRALPQRMAPLLEGRSSRDIEDLLGTEMEHLIDELRNGTKQYSS